MATSKYKERVIFYDKLAELHTAKNKSLCKLLGYNNIQKFNGILRVETSLRNKKALTKWNNIKDIKLLSILNSSKNINLIQFNKITQNKTSLIEFYENNQTAKKMTLSPFEKQKGQIQIIKELNYDLKEINKFLASIYKGRMSAKEKEYSLLRSKLLEDNKEVIECIDHLRELIKENTNGL